MIRNPDDRVEVFSTFFWSGGADYTRWKKFSPIIGSLIFLSGNRAAVTILDLPQDYSNDDNIAYSPLYNVIVNVLSV